MPITNLNYPPLMTMPRGYEGDLYDTSVEQVDTAINVSSGVIPFGFGLVWPGTTTKENGLVLPSATGFTFAGIAVLTNTFEKRSSIDPNFNSISPAGLFGYPSLREMGYLKRGKIIVYAEQAVNPKLPVFLRHTVGTVATVNLPGRWRTDADTAKADQISSLVCRWAETTTGPGLTVLTVNLP